MRTTMAAVVGILLTPVAALAAPSVVPWLGVSGSWATYSMSDVNRDIQNVNAYIAGTGLTMEEIHDGFGFGFTGGLALASGVQLGIGYDRLSARSDVGDATGSITYDFPANGFRVLGAYAFPSNSQFSPQIGVATGMVTADGSVRVSVTGSGSVSGDVTGSAPLVEAFVGGDYSTPSSVMLFVSLGYRHAKIEEVKVDDEIVYNADGSKYSLDYSGVLMRLGLKFTLTR